MTYAPIELKKSKKQIYSYAPTRINKEGVYVQGKFIPQSEVKKGLIQTVGGGLVIGSLLLLKNPNPGAVLAGKIGLSIGSFGILAPGISEKVLSTPGAPEVVIAGATGGAPLAIAVGAEKGVSLLGTVVEENAPKVREIIKEHTPEIVAGATALGVAGVATAVASQIPNIPTIPSTDEVISNVKDKIPTPIETPTTEPVATIPAQELPQGIQPEGSLPSPKRRKSSRKAQSIKVSQRVNVNVNQRQSANRITKRIINQNIYNRTW